MSDSFIPVTDAGALGWMQTFSGGISAAPATYMLTPADATTIADAVDAYAAAYTIAINPAQRTRVSIQAKDEARAIAEALCRQYAILIKYNAGINNPDKLAIGVRPVNDGRDPIACPQTSPILAVIAATPGRQNLRFSDSLTPDSRAKPFGASELQLFIAINDADIADPSQAQFYGKFTRNPIEVTFSHADNGKQATYFARWASRRGETGPWSAPVSLAIAA